MAQVHYYKRFENNLVQRVKNGALWLVAKTGSFFRAIFRFLARRYTVMLVPHSEKRVYNFHISVAVMCLFFLVFFGVAGIFFWYSAITGSSRGGITERDSRLRDTQVNLEQLKNEVNQLSRNARSFEAVLSSTLLSLGADPGAMGIVPSAGTRSSLFNLQGNDDVLKEVDDIRHLAMYLSSAVEPVKEIGAILDSQGAILSEIPSIWPLKGGPGIGHFTDFFGIHPDPFTGAPRMHTGIDISTYRQGDPIVATADGEVAYTGYEPSGFGNYIIIRHQHGFYTRYAHLLKSAVEKGQEVKQGETIGYVGNTGRSTGPHLHYEVHIGSDVVDPIKYLNIYRVGTR
ncbi:MAG: M23 family metallopeptidase [Spirochaetaceae bacterium]|jgi:murein DD-endopeptidase MepM/ murein hydrolase activator NlpD|nr:M23 family metallopeptidase [Spirochaetaceae bacterium]